jgi:amino acid adenylation domain-containing protein
MMANDAKQEIDQEVLAQWNETQVDFPEHLCVQQLFEAQVLQTPDAPAVLFGEHQLSYRELNERANRLAQHLRAQGVGPEQVVGICLEGSLELPVAVFAVLKAGAAYLPLDPGYPQNRLSFMLEDAGIRLVITQQRLSEKVAYLGVDSVLAIDAPEQEARLRQEPTENPTLLTTPRNACYVIYTSGSTGRPKGVVIEHRGLVNLVQALRAMLGLGPGRRVLQFASFSFDQSVQELFQSLLSGATLCLARREDLMPGEPLLRVLKEQHITDATLGPSVLAHLPDAELPELRTVTAGGEACPASVVARWAAGRRFFNAYGPTETTWASSAERCEPGGGRPNIGGPLANVRYYVVDEQAALTAVAEVGELLIGGVGVGRGYLNRPDLTAERFIPDAYSGAVGERLYRTGDLVKWLVGGKIDYVGRLDQQVKIRGFRIELGEIEALLSEHASVREAVLMAREFAPDDKRLVAYLVVNRKKPISGDELRTYLRQSLPDYMVPSVFVMMAGLPLTSAGKVDKQSLPMPAVHGGR